MSFRGSTGKSGQAKLTLNARVEMSPEALEQIVRETLSSHTNDDLKSGITVMRSLSPGRPNPTYRFDYVVAKENN